MTETTDENELPKDATSKWAQEYRNQFENESDRGCVLVSAAIIDELLKRCIKSVLAISPNPEKDNLFEGPQDPLSSFSSKIEFASRLGIISTKFSNNISNIGKRRNFFHSENNRL